MDGFMRELKAASSAAARADTALPAGGTLSSPFGEVDLSKHRDEAQQIWTMLDEMSDKDPEAYNKYIRQQMEDAMAEKTGRRAVTPDPGACFKTSVQRAKSLKRDDIGTVRGSEIFPFPLLPDDVLPGQSLYVNLCSHSMTPVPKTADRKSVLEAKGPRGGRREPAEWPLADLLALEIPLSIGNVRPVKGTARTEWAVDVLLHRWVIAVFEEHKGFPPNFVRFLASVMEEELGLVIDAAPGDGGVVEAPAAAKTPVAATAPAGDIGLREARSTSSKGKSTAATAPADRGWRLCRASYMGGDMAPGSTKQSCVPFVVSIRVGSPAEEALRGRKTDTAASGGSGSGAAAGSVGASGTAGGKSAGGKGGGSGTGEQLDVLASPSALLQAKASDMVDPSAAAALGREPSIILPGAAGKASSSSAAAGAAKPKPAPAKPSEPATEEERAAAAAAVASVAAAAAAIKTARPAAPLVQELEAAADSSAAALEPAVDQARPPPAADTAASALPLVLGCSSRCPFGTVALQAGDGGSLALSLQFDGAAVDTAQLRMQHVALDVAADAVRVTVDAAVLHRAGSGGAAAPATAVFGLPARIDPDAVGAKYSKKTASLTMTLQTV